ncbi:uncharacterized protein SPAPADRAFT_70331 [Spathaspora passalidarum NRRL Y-27907]|uniref:Myosin-binding domain-containing protein n=1 Tax=Spathaspora passalidarum (strain NRRL Y-27907 / 11-Y1) TaxID=619300 RepID=G3AHK6_SPAPN|nr:uncharacterized protein SPAPADRAFT_70331 [Spathaspora passalidarum NRRL Y-27907]EGW34170.1 hypothetical protein SPAPADRAFT_70331 [Spathaspora passalidarum NRRL Y-27907]
MNFDRFNPLSNFFSHNEDNSAAPPELGDWGIDDSVLSPSVSNNNHQQHQHYQQLQQQDSENQPHNFTYYYHKYCNQVIPPTTENFIKFIKKYLSMESKSDKFWEKFKYNLILSNLLEDTMILSKNEQSLSILNKSIEHESKHARASPFVYVLNSDGTNLVILEKHYNLKYNQMYNDSKLILLIINLIIYLLKQRKTNEHTNQSNQLKFFKIILIISTKLIKVKKFRTLVQTSQILNLLNEFLMSNYIVNKKIILQMIRLKELHTYNFLPGQGDNVSYKSHLHSHLLSSLSFLNLNLKSSIMDLLPVLNGDLLQQYCNINSIDLEILTQEYTPDDNQDEYINEIIFNITKFNQLRRLFICQLLAINQTPVRYNFFIYKLMDQFNLDSREVQISDYNRLNLIKRVMTNHNQTSSNIASLFGKFEVTTRKSASHENEDILKIKQPQHSIQNLQSLISKLSTLTTNLKFFDKYNQSDNESQEKLIMFEQFENDLKTINHLYSTIADDLNKTTESYNPISPSLSSNSSETFNLKSFRTSSSRSRYSTIIDEKLSPAPLETKKRSSAGLQLGLVTVVEEPHLSNKQVIPVSPETNLYDDDDDDDNVNIERYHQVTLDQLSSVKRTGAFTKAISFPQNRYSLNSVKSNVSGLTELITTQNTSPIDGDEDDGSLSKDALRLKLEESFNRIYNLETENKLLKNAPHD